MAKRRPVAIITGGTRGIGSGIAEAFAEEGYNLVLGFRENVEAAQAFRNHILEKYSYKKKIETELKSSDSEDTYGKDMEEMKIELICGSILDESTIAKYFKAVDETFLGACNVLVHNASQIYVPDGDTRHPYEVGQPRDSTYGNLLKKHESLDEKNGSPGSSLEYVDLTLVEHYSNLYSKCLINLAERALSRMKDDEGSIIFISSPGCNITQTVKPGYDMPGFGKSSGEFAIRYYAKNLQPRGINANTIIPGVVNTDAWNGYLKVLGPKFGFTTREECMKFMCKKSGQKRILEPVEIGKVATFLCKHGRCITGMSLNADGGIHLG